MNMEFGNSVQISEADVDPAFEQSGILTELGVLGTLALIQQVAGIKDGLNLAGEHPPGWQILRYGNAQSRIVIFHQPLVWVQTRRGHGRSPSVNRRNFGLRHIDFGFEPGRSHLKLPAGELGSKRFRRRIDIQTHTRHRGETDTGLEIAKLPIRMHPDALGGHIARIQNEHFRPSIR